MQTREKTEHPPLRTSELAEAARRLRELGRWSELSALLSGHPARELDSELAIMLAEAELRTGNSHKTVEIVDRVLAAHADLPNATRANGLLVRAMAARLRGFPQKALEDASAATAILESQTSPPELVIQGHKQIGISLASTGDLTSAIEHFERALKLCARSSDLRLMAEIQNALGLTCFRLGRLPEAQVHYKNAAAAYKKLDQPTELSDLFINMGLLHYNLGEYEPALQMNKEAHDIAIRANYHRSVSMSLVNIGDVQQTLGRPQQAIEAYEAALNSGADALEPRLFCCANTGLGSVFRVLKDPRRARFYLDQAIYEAERLNLKHELATARVVEGELALDDADYGRAKQSLEFSVRLYQEIGARRPLVRTYLRLGQVYLRSKRWKALTGVLEDLSRLTVDADLADHLVRDCRDAVEVVDYGASKRIGGSVFPSVRARLRGGSQIQSRRRRIADLRVPPGTAPLPIVELRSMGGLSVMVDGRCVDAAEWESQKAQEFFAFLLCNRQGRTREELIDVLWPDFSVKLSRNAFHNNVFRTRRALYKTCVVLDEGRYRLNPSGQFRFDLEAMRRLTSEAAASQSSPKRQIALLAEANKLYRGEFLQGINADWITPIRVEAEGIFLGNLLRLADLHEREDEYSEALIVLEHVLQFDQTDVDTQERIVKLLLRAGHVAEARQRHERFRWLMIEESASKPPRDFSALCQLAAAVR